MANLEAPTAAPKRVAWSPHSWAESMDCSVAWVYELLDQGKIKGKKVGRATRITTSPEEYRDSLPDYVSKRGTGVIFGREGR